MASKVRTKKKPDSTGIYLIVVGYEQEAKCNLLNALSRDKEAFKLFMCRTKPAVKHVRNETLSGREIILVQTASINTPAWTKMREEFLNKDYWKTRKCVFVYIATELGNADDDEAIKSLKTTFGGSLVRSVLCYNKHTNRRLFRESLGGSDQTFEYRIQLDADFETQVCESRRLLEKLKDLATERQLPLDTTGPAEVGSQKQTSIPEDDKVETDAVKVIDTVVLPDNENTPKIIEKLTQEHWRDFREALRYGKARSNHVRVNVVGNHGVGKSTLINRLLMKSVQCPAPTPMPTENLEVHRVMTRCVERNGTKYWEKEQHGTMDTYLEELNVQRMAQAMIHAIDTASNSSNEDMDYVSLESAMESLKSEDETVKHTNDQEETYDNTPVKWKTVDERSRFYLDIEQNTPGDVIRQNSSDEDDLNGGSEEVVDTDTPPSSHSTSSFFSPISSQSDMSVIANKDRYLKNVIYRKEELEREQNEKMYVSFWDYAGQSTYYATHHLFMSPSAVYLLVIDLRKELKDQYKDNLEFRSGILQSCTMADALTFWTRSIKAYTKDEHGGYAPIIIVGTHRGHVQRTEIEKKFNDIRKLLNRNAECIAIDNTLEPQEDETFAILKNKLIDVGLGILDERVSAQWINLEYDMQTSNICKKGYLKFSDLQKLDNKMDVPICNAVRLEAFLCHQHYRGHLLFYQHSDLKNLIITSPIILVEFLNLLFRRPDIGSYAPKGGWNEDGVLNQAYIIEIAERILQIEEFAYMVLLKILVKLNILHPLPSETADSNQDKYFLPCLLPDKTTPDTSDKDDCTKSPLFQIRFTYDSIHQTTYHQIVCGLLKYMSIYESNDTKEIYNLNVTFDVEDSLVLLVLSWDKSRLVFFIEDFCKGDVKPMNTYVDEVVVCIGKAIDDVLSVNRHEHVEYSIWVECPKHKRTFLSVDKLKAKSRVICDVVGEGKHSVGIEEINGIIQDTAKEEDDYDKLRQKPTDSILGRLAWKLHTTGRGETAVSLAVRLKLPCAFTKADIITRDLDDPGAEFLHLLIVWRNQCRKNQDCTILALLNLITKRTDYDREALKKAMFPPVRADPQIENVPSVSTLGHRDIITISNLLGRGYTFALIEMGIEWSHIEQERSTYRNDTKEMIFQLLLKWRRRDPDNSTTKRMLEAVKYVEHPLDPIISKLCYPNRPS